MQHVLSQLISKRAELKSEMNYLIRKANELDKIIESMDISIKVFDPNFNLDSIRDKRYTRKSQLFKHGEANKMTLDVLRKANKPLTTREIAQEIMKKKDLNHEDLELSKSIEARLRAVFYKNQMLKVVDETEKQKRWMIA
ncbi:hypothetical protein CRV08_04660 [Halarcobacter ebronensis]|uniref:Uncharacterized protein n=1 Tax=Halarcobacter ebronensis TaxID=1462615 RepID=A0A4Q0YHS5_9BACT|nr:HTH domain-containing protein [Halarcobacter ebronensis]RXJ69304.1 hypothetical protein CRV08_04660 [Halarcobacter ebronensis]